MTNESLDIEELRFYFAGMKRIHLFEFGDQPWFPLTIRRQGMELLATIFRITKTYAPTAKIISDLMLNTHTHDLVVLGAGSGGGILDVVTNLAADTQIVLTDIFPDKEFRTSDSRIRYQQKPVDALKVPADLKGIRVMYTAFHHFSPASAGALLQDAVGNKQPIAIFESTERSLRGLAVVVLLPVIVLLLTPFVRPFRPSRLVWTYVIPLLPIFVVWDGLVSSLRTYSASDLKPLLEQLTDYEWKFERLRGPHFEPLSALTGRPKA